MGDFDVGRLKWSQSDLGLPTPPTSASDTSPLQFLAFAAESAERLLISQPLANKNDDMDPETCSGPIKKKVNKKKGKKPAPPKRNKSSGHQSDAEDDEFVPSDEEDEAHVESEADPSEAGDEIIDIEDDDDGFGSTAPKRKGKGRTSNASKGRVQKKAVKGKNGKKTFVCSVDGCDKRFTTSGHLSRHLRIHSGLKPYKCPVQSCTSRFSRQDNMMQHYRTHVVKAANTKNDKESSTTGNEASITISSEEPIVLVRRNAPPLGRGFVSSSASSSRDSITTSPINQTPKVAPTSAATYDAADLVEFDEHGIFFDGLNHESVDLFGDGQKAAEFWKATRAKTLGGLNIWKDKS